jgi:hypothetical protein
MGERKARADIPKAPATVVFPTHDSIPVVMYSWYFLTCIMLARSSSVIPGGRGSFPGAKRGTNSGFCIVGNPAVTRSCRCSRAVVSRSATPNLFKGDGPGRPVVCERPLPDHYQSPSYFNWSIPTGVCRRQYTTRKPNSLRR